MTSLPRRSCATTLTFDCFGMSRVFVVDGLMRGIARKRDATNRTWRMPVGACTRTTKWLGIESPSLRKAYEDRGRRAHTFESASRGGAKRKKGTSNGPRVPALTRPRTNLSNRYIDCKGSRMIGKNEKRDSSPAEMIARMSPLSANTNLTSASSTHRSNMSFFVAV